MDDLVTAVLSALLGDRWMRRRSNRRAAEGEFDCALRAEGGGWEHGRARVAPGLLMFRRQGLRMSTSEGRPITVRWVDEQGRRPTGRESWGISPRATIYRMQTDEGLLDWAVVADRPEEAVRAVRQV